MSKTSKLEYNGVKLKFSQHQVGNQTLHGELWNQGFTYARQFAGHAYSFAGDAIKEGRIYSNGKEHFVHLKVMRVNGKTHVLEGKVSEPELVKILKDAIFNPLTSVPTYHDLDDMRFEAQLKLQGFKRKSEPCKNVDKVKMRAYHHKNRNLVLVHFEETPGVTRQVTFTKQEYLTFLATHGITTKPSEF